MTLTREQQRRADYEAAASRYSPLYQPRLSELVTAGMPVAAAVNLLNAEIQSGMINPGARGNWTGSSFERPAPAPPLAGSFSHRASDDDNGKGKEGESWEDWCRRARKALADDSTPAAEKRRIRRAIAAGEADEAATSSAAATLSVAELQAIAIAARAAADQFQQPATAASDPRQAELDRIFGIVPEGLIMGSRVRGALQEFGVMVPAPPATAKQAAPRAATAAPMPSPSDGLTAAQRETLDAAFSVGQQRTGVKMIGNRQVFGVGV